MARDYNALAKQAYDARCRVCTCGGFSPSSPQGEACTGAVLDRYLSAKQRMICEIGVEAAYKGCLEGALDCTTADGCERTRSTADAQCPAIDPSSPMAAPPAECQAH